MPNCIDELTEDILFDCSDLPIKGIEGSEAVLINWSDIDKAGSTESGATISDLVLKAAKTGYKLEWFKELASANSAFAPNTEDIDGFTNQFLSRLATTTADNAERANELKNGRFVVVYQTKWKGTNNESAFKVRGWENGLTLGELVDNTNENSGSITFTLGSEEGTVEQYPYRIFLETDYATSLATFTSLFASV